MVAPHISSPDILAAKKAARAQGQARREGRDPALGAELARHLLAEMPPPPGAVVSGFWPMGDEIDLRPLLHTLHGRGHRIVLPETPPRGKPLIFRLWYPGIEMVKERFGTERPTGEPLAPDVLLVPLLAFDRHGHRLGYGGGYYDRTLAGLPHVTAIGCAYASQELDSVPVAEYDAALDAVATEHGVLRFR